MHADPFGQCLHDSALGQRYSTYAMSCWQDQLTRRRSGRVELVYDNHRCGAPTKYLSSSLQRLN